jgi:hypothetical protein
MLLNGLDAGRAAGWPDRRTRRRAAMMAWRATAAQRRIDSSGLPDFDAMRVRAPTFRRPC